MAGDERAWSRAPLDTASWQIIPTTLARAGAFESPASPTHNDFA
jgi:hypothetical protein